MIKTLTKIKRLQNWIKLKWGHPESTRFQITQESSKSVHLVERSEITNVKKLINSRYK